MSTIILPTTPVPATRKSPKILVLYGMPKVGKTEALSQLPGCLILDTEGGSEMYDAMRIPINSYQDFYGVRDAIVAEGKKRIDEGKKGQELFPYKHIAIDTLDKLEDYAEASATVKYKNSILGKKFDGKSVLELPQGGGWYHLRNELQTMVNEMARVCPRLILITHVKEKLLAERGGAGEVSVNDISLTGKLSSIICAKADAIGYLYRTKANPNLQVNFETLDSSIMGSRAKYLAGQKFEFDWNKIYVD